MPNKHLLINKLKTLQKKGKVKRYWGAVTISRVKEREVSIIVMQMSLLCLLFVAENLISSSVATIQTGGMLRMLLMTHTDRRDRLKNTSFRNVFQRVATVEGPTSGSIFLVYDKICFFVS